MPGRGRSPEDFDECSERLWPDPDQGPYRLTLLWERRDGRPVAVGMLLVGADAKPGATPALTTSALRELKIAEIVAEDREGLAYIPPAQPTPQAVVEGMRPATLRRLTKVAEVYQAAWRVGDPPTQAVARELKVSGGAAANLVRRARAAGLLPPTTGGVPQG